MTPEQERELRESESRLDKRRRTTVCSDYASEAALELVYLAADYEALCIKRMPAALETIEVLREELEAARAVIDKAYACSRFIIKRGELGMTVDDYLAKYPKEGRNRK